MMKTAERLRRPEKTHLEHAIREAPKALLRTNELWPVVVWLVHDCLRELGVPASVSIRERDGFVEFEFKRLDQ